MRRLAELTEQRWKDAGVLGVARLVKAMYQARGAGVDAALAVYANADPESPFLDALRQGLELRVKGAVDPMTAVTNATLLPSGMAGALLALAAPFSIIARLGLARVPFNLQVPAETVAPSAWWVDTGKLAPMSRAALNGTTLPPRVAAGLVVVSTDLVRFGTPAGDVALSSLLAKAFAGFIDAEFCDPARAVSVLAGSPIATAESTGTAASDVETVLRLYKAGGGSMERCALILSSANAAGAVLQGNNAFRNLERQGGTIGALPAVCGDAAGSVLIAVDTGRVLLADDGDVAVDIVRHASVEASDDPENEAGTLVSLFQQDLVGIKVERVLNWQALPGAAAYVSGCDYLGGAGSPA